MVLSPYLCYLMKKCRLLLFLWFLSGLTALDVDAQTVPARSGEYLVSLPEFAEIMEVGKQVFTTFEVQKVADFMNLWLIRNLDPKATDLNVLRRHPLVRQAQYNHFLESRDRIFGQIPNDPHFSKQWYLLNDGTSGGMPDADLDAEEAWDISKGGITPAGDTIVLAVIDGGIDATHPDIAPNLWYNRLEIPNNGLDDDQNGFTDDFRGWNVFTQDDAIAGSISTHGTPVSGILGAKGDNGVGVTGVNWNTRMMFVSALGTESEVLAAYDYVWKMRKLYNETGGARGAFIVAVNCSWGINYGQPLESPIWCEAFDVLGASGILSVAATANIPVNVDEVGDLPTACPSLYLLSVTSLNHWDVKAENAAWGKTHVDLGAYGQDVFTVASGGGYGTFAGTSFATPEVTGAVGLLYSAPCPSLISLAKNNPAGAAYWVKSLILDAVSGNESLNNYTASNGRLNLNQALMYYQGQCSNCPTPFALKVTTLTDSSAYLEWSAPLGVSVVNLRWRRAGIGSWQTISEVVSGLWMEDLWSCTAYEFEMQSVCTDSLLSAWSPPLVFETKGCCTAPEMVWVVELTDETAKLTWDAGSFNDTYRLRLTNLSTGNGQILEVDSSVWTLEGLDPCTQYRVQIQARCEDWLTPFSNPFEFKTKGCGACNELEYCNVSGILAAQEWISSVQLGLWSHVSGIGGTGYQNFSLNPIVSPVLFANTFVPFIITPGFLGVPSKQYYQIYIDFNQDGDFMDDDELAYDPGFAFIGAAEGFISVPSILQPGLTRMRVIMRYSTPNDPPPMACEGFEFGQVEDYCVSLQTDSIFTETMHPELSTSLKIFPQPSSGLVGISFDAFSPNDTLVLHIMDTAGRPFFKQTFKAESSAACQLDISAWPAGVYVVAMENGNKRLVGKLLKY